MGISGGPYIVRDSSLILELDAADKNSYIGSGTVWSDLSGNNRSGSLANTPTFSTTNNGIFTFNGTNQYVSLTLPSLTSYSIVFWMRILSYDGTERQVLYTFNDSVGLTLYTNKFLLWNGNVNVGNTTFSLNTWYNVVEVGSGTTTVLYLNGVSDGSFNNFTNISSGAAAIGYNIVNSSRYLNANIASFQIYNRALSATEVTRNYNEQKSRFGL